MTFRADRRCHILIIGGGVIGAALAYHLGRAGANDVLVFEKAQLTHGSTWHAAGLVGQLRGKRNLTRLMQNSVAVFDRLERETGGAISWHKTGSLRLASSPERWSEIRRSMTQARSFGVECHSLSPAEAKRTFPFLSVEGVVGAAFIPGDGYVDPYSLTMAFASVARADGVKIEEGSCVREISVEGRRVQGVITDGGAIGCDVLVNCAGIWAKRVGAMAGVAVAAGVVEHQYFVTEKKLDFDQSLTTLRDPDHNFYLKPDTGAFAVGGWEQGTKGCWRGLPPLEFGRELFPPSLERLELFAIPAALRLPVLNDIGVRTVINGPIPVSADGEPILGPAPGLDNMFLACGFTAGIAASGGAGEAMANWILNGDPGMDLWSLDSRRFGALHAQGRYLEARAIEAYAAYYRIHRPGEESHAARGLRLSPLYHRLEEKGAVFGSKFGWERPNWFVRDGSIGARDEPSFEGRPNWFESVAAEHRAIRERAALIDQTSFSKLEIRGRNARQALDRIAANDLSGPPGKAVYTQLCNEKGGIEADVTVIHSADDLLYVITGSGFGVRDSDWIARHLPGDGSVTLTDVTNSWATINICGPQARHVLQKISDDDLSAAAWPYRKCGTITLANASVGAVRIGYVGELGFELYVPQEYAPGVYDALWQAGEEVGIANAGYRAIDSCRLEKGYLYWSGDISPDYNPFEAGLGFCVALDKGEFIGRKALARIKAEGVKRCLCSFTVEGFAPFHGSEAILYDGRVVGATTSAGFGHTLGKTIAFGYLAVELQGAVDFEIEAFGNRYRATRGSRCLYDARMQRLKS
jgi:4-methylaminobutanoate oxidase (formaldehyde-forming)